MIETFEDMKNIPVTSMAIGDILKYFEVIAERKHGGDEDVKRSVSEVASRFMAEALYKYYNHKDADNETSDAPAREECETWKEKVTSANFYPPFLRMTIVRDLTNEFKNDLVQGRISFSEENKNFFFKVAEHPNCMLTLRIKDKDLVITYYIGDTTYTHKVPVEASDFTDKSSGEFWGKYAEIIISSSNKLVAQIKEGH